MNGYFILFIAISIASVAAYYSIIGLATLFAGAVIPVIIMGIALEVAKLVTAAWLHQNWSHAPFLLKSYLTSAVIVLMLITSMGIFGFLSRAHIEKSGDLSIIVTQIEQNEIRISQIGDRIESIEADIADVSSRDSNTFEVIQSQIETEQENIDRIYARIQPDIDRLEETLRNSENRRSSLEENVASIQELVQQGNIVEVQRILGIQQDGSLGPQTQSAIDSYTNDAEQEISEINSSILELQSRIAEIRSSVDPLVASSNEIIDRLRGQISFTDSDVSSETVSSLEREIETLIDSRSALIEENFELDRQVKLFEVEVGPIKYVAEIIYGSSDPSILEKTIRFVILLIIFVFDPLAVLLVIAAGITPKRKKELQTEQIVATPIVVEQQQEEKIVEALDVITGSDVPNEDKDVVSPKPVIKKKLVINKFLPPKNSRNFKYFFRRG